MIWKLRTVLRTVNTSKLFLRLQSTASTTRHLFSSYEEAYKRSILNPEEFWGEAGEELTWFKKWDKVIDNSNPPHTKWFCGGKINHCYNSIDRHVEHGRGNQCAIIHDSPVTNTIKKISFNELKHQVSHLAGMLSSQCGVKYGDRVMVYMPMIPEAIVSMMATVRLGGVHVVVFGGFAAKELSARITGCKPKVILSASYGIEGKRRVDYKPILDEAIRLADHKPKHNIVLKRSNSGEVLMEQGRDLDWDEEMAKAHPHDCVPVDAMDPMYLLYTSGTTGVPKAAVRPTAGHSVVLHWSMKNVYGVSPGEVYWAAADLGWAVGHSYGAHAPLLQGTTTVLYEVLLGSGIIC